MADARDLRTSIWTMVGSVGKPNMVPQLLKRRLFETCVATSCPVNLEWSGLRRLANHRLPDKSLIRPQNCPEIRPTQSPMPILSWVTDSQSVTQIALLSKTYRYSSFGVRVSANLLDGNLLARGIFCLISVTDRRPLTRWPPPNVRMS